MTDRPQELLKRFTIVIKNGFTAGRFYMLKGRAQTSVQTQSLWTLAKLSHFLAFETVMLPVCRKL